MKILIFYSGPIVPNSGGVQNVAFSIANYLNSNGNNVYFLSFESIAQNNPNYFFLPNKEKINSKLNIEYTLDLINKYSIDLILNLDGLNSKVLEFLLKLKGVIKIFNVIHNTFLPQNTIFNKYFKYFFKSYYLFVFYFLKQIYYNKLDRCSDKIILFSKSNLDDIKYFKKDKKFISKVHYIPNPIKVPIGNNNISKENQIIFVGRLDDNQKNISYILKMWSMLSIKYHNWKLLILGSGIDRDKLVKFSKNLNLKNIYFLGNVNPYPYYEKSKFLILTSRFEGWPMVIPEAMSYGCVPCVLNSFTSLNDMIINNFNGHIFNDNNLRKNVNIFENILTNKNFPHISQNCIDTSKNFSIDQIGMLWTELLQ